MKVEAVIGANYGDEGKGLFTDYLCANRPNPIVVMTNGGSQRGHTVELEDGTRYVFHHFGSGTLRGAVTYFPKSYLLNPIQFMKEYDELKKLGYEPTAVRHEDCVIQLPCDIALNWHIEKSRGGKRHGSVGCGIWETKYRMYNDDAWTLTKFCSTNYEDQVKYIKDQAKKYRDLRCKEEGLSRYAEIYDLFMSDGFIDHFISDCLRMSSCCFAWTGNLKSFAFDNKCETLVFENGQGLKLDQFYGADGEANTTPSFTGSIGIAKILDEEGIVPDSVDLNYVSRTYLTKHGAGKFAESDRDYAFMFNSSFSNTSNPIVQKTEQTINSLDSFKNNDKTNVWNEWQESLRFATLNYDELLARCNKDISMFSKFFDKGISADSNIVMTHANEIPIDEKFADKIKYVSNTKFAKDIIKNKV